MRNGGRVLKAIECKYEKRGHDEILEKKMINKITKIPIVRDVCLLRECHLGPANEMCKSMTVRICTCINSRIIYYITNCLLKQ